MKVKISERALEIYTLFKEKEGAEYIATPVSIQFLLDSKPKTVLELGGGIGTLTYTATSNGASVDSYEDNAFCQEQLRINAPKANIIQSYVQSPPKDQYDIIIVDGGSGKSHDGGYDGTVVAILKKLHNINTIYIEGHRKIQSILIQKELSRNYVYRLKFYRRINEWKGGLRIDCRRSKSNLLKKLNYIFWRFVDVHALMKTVRYKTFKILGLG